MSLILPALILVYHYASGKKLIRPILPLAAIAAGYIALRLAFLKGCSRRRRGEDKLPPAAARFFRGDNRIRRGS